MLRKFSVGPVVGPVSIPLPHTLREVTVPFKSAFNLIITLFDLHSHVSPSACGAYLWQK
jgi:hypothetical protein